MLLRTVIGTICVSLLALAVTGCTIATPTIHHHPPSLHSYYVTVTDAKGKPVADATVTGTFFDHTTRIGDTLVNTDGEGEAVLVMRAKPDSTDQYQNAFESRCEISVAKEGFLPQYGTMNIRYVLTDLSQRGDKGLNESETTVTLHTPDEFVGQAISAAPDQKLFQTAKQFAAAVHREYAVEGTGIESGSITLRDLGEGNFLTISLRTDKVVNLDALDNSGIVRAFFEMAGRKTVELFRDNLASMPEIQGIAVTITGKKKHFTDRGADPEPVECKYYIPRALFATVTPDAVNARFLEGSAVYLDNNQIAVKGEN